MSFFSGRPDHVGTLMLKGIDPLINAPLLQVMAAMGHGDELAVVDRNYPAYSTGRPVIHLDGVETASVLIAILKLFPLDTFVDHPMLHMHQGDGSGAPLPVHTEALAVATEADGRPLQMAPLLRGDFYERARNSQAIVTTGEARPYACFILIKGVVPAPQATQNIGPGQQVT